jgi:hypothetical protein
LDNSSTHTAQLLLKYSPTTKEVWAPRRATIKTYLDYTLAAFNKGRRILHLLKGFSLKDIIDTVPYAWSKTDKSTLTNAGPISVFENQPASENFEVFNALNISR